MKKRLTPYIGKLLVAVAISSCFGVGAAYATDFSFTGNFNQDDDVQLFNFSVANSSTVTLRSYSYAGGTNAAGDTIAAGGFDPILALFDAGGTFIDSQDDAGNNGNIVPPGPDTGARYDVKYSETLGVGEYTVALSEYDNFHNGDLSDGFEHAGDGNFTGSEFGCGAGTAYCDATGDTRDNHWAFDVLNVATASTPTTGVPEPSALLLMGAGLIGLGFAARKRQAGNVGN